ncbi:MAG: NAD(P)-dependent oxidoreductase [Actinomycetota bacterium]|nr:NAD(P)-dependent oxidoreductase [Actinomycetota bacterium]
MGLPMARNLVRAGYPVRAFDVRDEPVRDLAGDGAVAARSCARAAEGCDVVLVSLPDSPQVESAVLGPGGVVEGARPGAAVVDLSTIGVAVTRRIAETLSERGVDYLDAPVSGGQRGALHGALSIMVGGPADAFARARPVLGVLGATVTHVGDCGMGQVFKLCNQVVCALNIQAVCEALALGRAAGADLTLLREALAGGAAGSWMLDNLAPAMIAGDASAGFTIQLQLKDLRLALEAAFEAGVPLPGAAQAMALYLEARAHGEDANGNQALFRVYDRLTGHADD